MLKRLDNRQVGVVRLHVLAYQRNVDARLMLSCNDRLPVVPKLSALGHASGVYRNGSKVESGS